MKIVYRFELGLQTQAGNLDKLDCSLEFRSSHKGENVEGKKKKIKFLEPLKPESRSWRTLLF